MSEKAQSGLQRAESVILSDCNPEPAAKRQKRADVERKRVSRACDRCKQKKTRCSGRQPCTICTRSGLSCEFTAAYTRGRLPIILPEDPQSLQENLELTPSRPCVDSPSAPQEGLQPEASYAVMNDYTPSIPNILPLQQASAVHLDTESRIHSSRNSPDPSQTDLQGHYVGPSSGVSFLLRVQKKLHERVSFSKDSSIFTFGDAPLPEFDPSYFILPPKPDAKNLLAKYFDFAVATHRFLHRPTVEHWLDELYDNSGVMPRKDGAKEKIALIFMVFAQAREYLPGTSGSDSSARYFQAAEHQLSSETGQIRLTSVQARLCQCFYLLSQSRVNHCWALFGTTAHLILALGIHRKRRLEAASGVDMVELECRKRVFWCAYGLDSYLSAALGRPRTFHDEDVDQELPNCVNDSDLTAARIISNPSKAQSIMLGSIAHNTLSQILNHILRDLYAIRAPSHSVRLSLSATYTNQLLEWRQGLSRFLDADGVDASLLIPLFQRQRNVLNLAYYHAMILVHRPFLLNNFASLNSRGSRRQRIPQDDDIDKNVDHCLLAAVKITDIVNELTEARQIFRAFWFTHYFAFCAMVVLYVYTIQRRQSSQDTHHTYFDTAAKCQTQLSMIAENESLAQRYSVVLEELRLEASKQAQQAPPAQSRYSNTENQTQNLASTWNIDSRQDESNHSSTIFASSEVGGLPEALGPTTPSSLMAELTSWGEFDSLVTAGIGGLDFTFINDQTRWEGNFTSGYNNSVL